MKTVSATHLVLEVVLEVETLASSQRQKDALAVELPIPGMIDSILRVLVGEV